MQWKQVLGNNIYQMTLQLLIPTGGLREQAWAKIV